MNWFFHLTMCCTLKMRIEKVCLRFYAIFQYLTFWYQSRNQLDINSISYVCVIVNSSNIILINSRLFDSNPLSNSEIKNFLIFDVIYWRHFTSIHLDNPPWIDILNSFNCFSNMGFFKCFNINVSRNLISECCW